MIRRLLSASICDEGVNARKISGQTGKHLRLIINSCLGGAPHRKVGRLVALEDSVDVAARARIGTPINFHVFISRLV